MQRRRASLSTVTVTGSPGGPGDSESGMAHGNLKPSAAVPGQVQPPWAESPPAGVRTSVTSVQADYRDNKRVQSCAAQHAPEVDIHQLRFLLSYILNHS